MTFKRNFKNLKFRTPTSQLQPKTPNSIQKDKRESRRADVSLIIDKVIAGLTLIGLGVAIWGGWSTAKSVVNGQKQFEIGNQPYLQISAFEIDPFISERNTFVRYRINNLGSQPVKILREELSWGFYLPGNDTLTEQQYWPSDNKQAFTYVSKELPYEGATYIPAQSEKITSVVNKGYAGLFLRGDYTYLNLTTNKLNKYRFLVKFDPPFEAKYFKAAYNDNVKYDSTGYVIPPRTQ